MKNRTFRSVSPGTFCASNNVVFGNNIRRTIIEYSIIEPVHNMSVNQYINRQERMIEFHYLVRVSHDIYRAIRDTS